MTLRVNARQGDRDAVLATWRAAGIEGTAGRAERPRAGAAAAGARAARASPRAWCRCRTPPPSWPRPCCWTACGAGRPAAARARRLRRARRQDRAPAGTGRCRGHGAGRRPGALRRIDETLARLRPAGPRRGRRCRPTCRRWWDGQPFDAILLDAPCTASGIVRRHPDVRWLRREGDIAQLAAQQARLLDCAVAAACARRAAAVLHLLGVPRRRRRTRSKRFLHTTKRPFAARARAICCPRAAGTGEPSRTIPPGDHDGFFYALLDKVPAGCAGPAAGCLSARLRVGAALLLLLAPSGSRARTCGEVTQLRLERTDDGVLLSSSVRFDLPPLVEDALAKGIPMFFVAEADAAPRPLVLVRQAAWPARTRHMRLSYQPLTRRWRLQVSSAPIGNSGLALGQNFDTREEALAAVQRISRWRIADAGRPRSRRAATASTSASGSTSRSCRGRSRSARSARPTGTSAPRATQRLAARVRDGEHAARARAAAAPAHVRKLARGALGDRWSAPP